MVSHTLTPMSTIDSLIGAYRSHVLARTVPEPATVDFAPRCAERISVQAGGGMDTVRHLADLLTWAHTLGDASARWWHTTEDRLHLSVTGRTTSGVRIKVYGGSDFDKLHGLVLLPVGESEVVSLDELHVLVELLTESQGDEKRAA